MLPRVYRTGANATPSAEKGAEGFQSKKRRKGFGVFEDARGGKKGESNAQAPDYRPAPNRWIVVRWLEMGSVPEEAAGKVEPYQAWLVESDRCRNITDLGDEVDIEVDVSPFVNPGKGLDEQAECVPPRGVTTHVKVPAELISCRVFIGGKRVLSEGRLKAPQSAVYIPFSVLHSSNHLFADYQPHNSNVFSLLDTFSYTDSTPGQPPTTKHLSKATANYYVIGWHSDPIHDLFHVDLPPPINGKPAAKQTHQDLLKSLMMQLKNGSTDDAKDWLAAAADHGRTVLTGAMYEVHWDTGSPPARIPAKEAAEKLADMPIAVGTTPLDSILTFVQAHHQSKPENKPGGEIPAPEVGGDNSGGNDSSGGDNSPSKALDLQQVEDDILKLQTLLLKQDGGLDAHSEAEDLLPDEDYSKLSGGVYWHFSDRADDGRPIVPTLKQRQSLTKMNSLQMLADACTRQSKLLRWQLFAHWWQHTSQPTSTAFEQLSALEVRFKVRQLMDALQTCLKKKKACEEGVTSLRRDLACESGTRDVFFKRKEPTVMIAGIGSAWPTDWIDPLEIRLDSQLVTYFDWRSRSTSERDSLDAFVNKVLVPNVPKDLQGMVLLLWREFYILRHQGPELANNIFAPQVFPLYHDVVQDSSGKDVIRDSWGDSQPWFPLFVEWEAIYYHIPFENWAMQSYEGKIRYGLNTFVGSGFTVDARAVSGRSLILPQPGYSVKNNILQLFKNTSTSTLDAIMPEAERTTLLKNIDKLEYLSFPLDGLTEHLLTMYRGTHAKPNLRRPGNSPVPMPEAIDEEAGFSRHVLEMMGAETNVTPYASLVDLEDINHSPFKPVTHGQMFFTKVNIVDKFGQVVCAVDPTPKPPQASTVQPQIYPCISDTLSCWPLVNPHGEITRSANAVVPEDGSCAFVQLPPSINQDARLNSVFVLVEEEQDDSEVPWRNGKGQWRPIHEWENPVWGWLVINYADYGIQIFLPDGTFYREVRLGGPIGASASAKWLPFDPPASIKVPDDGQGSLRTAQLRQLDLLVSRLAGDASYLQGFVDMVSNSLGYTRQTPNTYSEFLPSVVGKPLALVNFGLSLELATEPLKNYSSLVDLPPDRSLLPEDGREYYMFPVKLGDKDRVHDGLVGYFNSTVREDGTAAALLDLDLVYTYFPRIRPPRVEPRPDAKLPPQSKDNDPTRDISPNNFPSFEPYYISPLESYNLHKFSRRHASHLRVFGGIMDPFTPIHAYTAELLPIKAMTLPPWVIKSAMDRMTAFFHVGPILNVANLPAVYNTDYKLESGYNLADDTVTVKGVPGVQVPYVPIGEWRWLQPFVVDAEDKEEKKETRYNAFATALVDMKPTWPKGPYTAMEGYLQLVKPIMEPVTANDQKKKPS